MSHYFCVVPVQKGGQHWESHPASPDPFWGIFIQVLQIKLTERMKEIRVLKCSVALLSLGSIGFTASWTSQAAHEGFLAQFWETSLGVRVTKGLPRGLVEGVHQVWLPLLCQKLHTFPFSRAQSEASLEPRGSNAFLSTMGETATVNVLLQHFNALPASPCCFVSGLLVPSHTCLSPGSPVISLWFSSLTYK